MYRHSSGRLALAALASTLLLASCSVLNEIILEPDQTTIRGSGVVTEEEREVSGFTGIELATLGTVYV